MSRYAILNMVDAEGCRALASGKLTEEDALSRLTGCVWLFRVSAEVDDVEMAARDAVREYFSSEEGRRTLQDEDLTSLTWAAAISWVPDEVWARFGLEPIGHPDVERVLLDSEEDLRGELDPPTLSALA